jgi:hypothetical protein
VLPLLSFVHLTLIIPRILITQTAWPTHGCEITVEQTDQVDVWYSILPEYICKFITERHPYFEFDEFVIHLVNNIHHAMKDFAKSIRFDPKLLHQIGKAERICKPTKKNHEADFSWVIPMMPFRPYLDSLSI